MHAPAVAVGAAFAVALAVTLLLVATRRWHAAFSLDTMKGPQKFHTVPTPRIAGIAIACGVGAGLAAAPRGGLLTPLVWCALPAFAAGLLEDLTKSVSIRARLLATGFSAVLAFAVTGAGIQRLDLPGIDLLLAAVPISCIFTVFCITGVANAFNIIDGFNGLSGGTVVLCAGALAAIAGQAGDAELVLACLLVMGATAGFLPLNFPSGRIFMGDGGAFLLGFLVAWLAVLLPLRNAGISPWASLMACAYPILETLFSIWRKSHRAGYHPGLPDRVHLHMLLHRRVVRRFFPTVPRPLQNSLTSPLAWGCALVPGFWAAAWPTSTSVLAAGFCLCALMYAALYLRLTQFRWCLAPSVTGEMVEGT